MGHDEGIAAGFLDSALRGLGFTGDPSEGSFVLGAVLVDPGATEARLRPSGDQWYLLTFSPETVLSNPDLLDRWREDMTHYVALRNVEAAFGLPEEVS